MSTILGIPLGMAVAILLSALSIAGQALITVERMDGLSGPTSLWFLIVASSGGRKSAAEDCAYQPIREFEIERTAYYAEALNEFEATTKAWAVKERVALDAIRDATKEGENTEILESRLGELHKHRPRKPKQMRFLFNDISSAGIKERLHDSTPSIGIATDEGSGLFKGNALVDLSLPNRLWSGGTIQVDRGNGRCFTVRDPRLTLSIQTQPGALKRYLERKGEEAREEGFWNRMLVCFPEIPFGQRWIVTPNHTWREQRAFRARIREILELNVTPDGQPPEKTKIPFSQAAQERWIKVHNDIESMVAPGGYYGAVPDYGAKIADNVARTSGLYHLFKGATGDISLETLEQAIGTVAWFTEEFMRVLAPKPQLQQDQLDAHSLEVWFARKVRYLVELPPLSRNYILQCGSVRNAARLSVALERLMLDGKIRLHTERKRCWVILNPNFFTQQQIEILCNQASLTN